MGCSVEGSLFLWLLAVSDSRLLWGFKWRSLGTGWCCQINLEMVKTGPQTSDSYFGPSEDLKALPLTFDLLRVDKHPRNIRYVTQNMPNEPFKQPNWKTKITKFVWENLLKKSTPRLKTQPWSRKPQSPKKCKPLQVLLKDIFPNQDSAASSKCSMNTQCTFTLRGTVDDILTFSKMKNCDFAILTFLVKEQPKRQKPSSLVEEQQKVAKKLKLLLWVKHSSFCFAKTYLFQRTLVARLTGILFSFFTTTIGSA